MSRMTNSDYKQPVENAGPADVFIELGNPHSRLTLEAAPHQRYYSPSRFSFRERRSGARKPLPQNYVPIFIFIAVVGVLIPITLLLTKLVRDRVYDSACFLTSDAVGGRRGNYKEPSPELSIEKFIASLLAKAIAIAKVRE